MHIRQVDIFTDAVSPEGMIKPNAAHWGCTKPTEGVTVEFTIAENDYTGDDTIVTIYLTHVDGDGSEEEPNVWDTDVKTHNNDWAGLRKQAQFISAAVDEFYKMGLDTRFGKVIEG